MENEIMSFQVDDEELIDNNDNKNKQISSDNVSKKESNGKESKNINNNYKNNIKKNSSSKVFNS